MSCLRRSSPSSSERIRTLAPEVASLVGLRGVARLDFLSDGEDVFINEINTIPGSLSHYLWIDPRLPFTSLLLDLLAEAIQRPAAAYSSAGSDGSVLAARGVHREQARMSCRLTPGQALMSFPTRLLGPGEEVYLDSRPNWSYLFWPSVFTVLVLAGCVAAVVLWTSAPPVAGWVLLGMRPRRARVLSVLATSGGARPPSSSPPSGSSTGPVC